MDRQPQCQPPVPKHSSELQTAVQDDVRRQEVDSAKKRAAAQNVDYESFAALVSMAHVKPFWRRKGQQEESTKQNDAVLLPAWSFDASGELAASDRLQVSFCELSCQETHKRVIRKGASFISNLESLVAKTNGDGKAVEEVSLIATTDEDSSAGCFKASCMTSDAFKREWRRAGMNLGEKLKLLLALTPGELSKIFKAELPPSILADVIEVLCWWRSAGGRRSCSDALHSDLSSLEPFDFRVAFQVLSSLRACGRFTLSLKLVGTRVQSLAIQLIKDFAQSLRMHDVCDKIADNPPVMCFADQQADAKAVTCHGTRETEEPLIHKDDLEHLVRCYLCL